ncbi:hypothetical protein Cfor_05007, partial [Coptotermes formosanus]
MGFKFSKEPSCIIQQEKQYVDNQMSLLRPTKYFNAGKALSAKYTLLMTMINGEVASAITNTASQTCHLCGTKPSQMNNIEDVVDLNVNEGSLQYGISVLHPWIHMFGCLLHIAYRLEVKQWQVKKNEKHLVEKGKKKIQEKFRQCLEAFERYAEDVAKLYVREYGWYDMPMSMHKILIHGHLLISSAQLPIGQLAEEAQEARHKYFG